MLLGQGVAVAADALGVEEVGDLFGEADRLLAAGTDAAIGLGAAAVAARVRLKARAASDMVMRIAASPRACQS